MLPIRSQTALIFQGVHLPKRSSSNVPESRHLTPIRPRLDPRLTSGTLRSVWAFLNHSWVLPKGLSRPPGRALDEYPTGAKSNTRPTSRLLNPRRSERTGSTPPTARLSSRFPPLNLSRPQGCLRPRFGRIVGYRLTPSTLLPIRSQTGLRRPPQFLHFRFNFKPKMASPGGVTFTPSA